MAVATAVTEPPGPTGRESLLAVRGLTKQFGGVHALEDVSFDVSQGEIFGIIGSNGAGKTTLLGLMSGALRPTAGEVYLDGAVISGLRASTVARRGVARAHQIPRPFREMSVREHVDLAARIPCRARRTRRARVDAILEQAELQGHAERRSGGLGLLDLKRLEIARAVAVAPRVLLLDEVAAGLVGREVDDVVRLIDDLRTAGMTIVMVEHVQAVIRELAARVLVLEWGRVLTEGTPAEVAADPRVLEAYLGVPAGEQSAPPEERGSRPAPLLTLESVSVNYGKLTALRACDLTIGAGEVVAVVGANGAGKTTLAGAVSGLVPVRSGQIQFDGQNITALPPHQRARAGIALCAEGRRLFTEQTVEDNLRLAARRIPAAQVRERLDGVVDLFPELANFWNRPCGALSGGQQQMVAIARALVLDPKVILFDELSLGLAPRVAARLIAAIPLLRDRGLAVLLIEQHVTQALTVADHVYVLDRGRITFSGSPAGVHADERLRDAYLGTQSTQSLRTTERTTEP
jgi:branched-chain amino acid transport system ATP-binding protein